MWKNIVEPGRPQVTIWRMRIACGIPMAINKLSEYVILIAFILQQWMHERSSVLRYTCIACLVSPVFYALKYSPITEAVGDNLVYMFLSLSSYKIKRMATLTL
jgi:hypothetical protein